MVVLLLSGFFLAAVTGFVGCCHWFLRPLGPGPRAKGTRAHRGPGESREGAEEAQGVPGKDQGKGPGWKGPGGPRKRGLQVKKKKPYKGPPRIKMALQGASK